MQPGNQPYGYPQPGQLPGQPQNQYAPQFQQTQSQQAPQSTAAPLLGFADPSGGVANPTARHLNGRTIAIIPKRVDDSATYQGQPRPTAYFDLYVLDGGPILYGDSEDRANPRPFTHTIDTPCFFADAQAGNVLFVNEVKSKLDANGRPTAMAVGVVQQGTRGNKPWLLTRFEKDVDGNERPDGAARRDALQKLVNDHAAGAWTPPRATPLAQAQTPQVAPVQYGAQAYGPTHTPQPQYASATYGQGAPFAAAVQPQPAAATLPGQQLPPAPGWEGNPAWGQFSPETQMQIWQQVNAQQANTAQGAPGGTVAPAAGQASAPPAQTVPVPPASSGPGW